MRFFYTTVTRGQSVDLSIPLRYARFDLSYVSSRSGLTHHIPDLDHNRERSLRRSEGILEPLQTFHCEPDVAMRPSFP